ncbi:MAG: rhodanese-like domain-containing protein [Gammaproteobacteria bacterium]|nr:rhodanese-like domain-containing protein [Gammaproteobacteria bacterium]
MLSEAAKIAVPEAIKGVTRVDAEGLIELAEQIPDLIIVDARQRADRRQGYIQDSVSLPDTDTTCDSLKGVIPALGAPALFYCNGVKCGRSVIALQIAKSCGYAQLYWFRGGFEEWKQKGYPFPKL